MTEYDKMITGQLYNALDPELVKMRQDARQLLTKINQNLGDIRENGQDFGLCKSLFGDMGRNLWLQPPFYCDYGRNISLGDNVYINFNCVILDVAPVRIGSHVMMGPAVQIYTASHPLDAKERAKGLELGKAIRIEDHVWLGGGCILCPGVTIGAGSIVAAGAVVTKDVPPGVIVGGNPVRVIRSVAG